MILGKKRIARGAGLVCQDRAGGQRVLGGGGRVAGGKGAFGKRDRTRRGGRVCG